MRISIESQQEAQVPKYLRQQSHVHIRTSLLTHWEWIEGVNGIGPGKDTVLNADHTSASAQQAGCSAFDCLHTKKIHKDESIDDVAYVRLAQHTLCADEAITRNTRIAQRRGNAFEEDRVEEIPVGTTIRSEPWSQE
mmetsp:Transcript_12457/g.31590  ORF Transcript_12457/g.31590 Transcript_12457/m.31590 type:complete len:137 (+) Transcript_12457:1257-1667(+)